MLNLNEAPGANDVASDIIDGHSEAPMTGKRVNGKLSAIKISTQTPLTRATLYDLAYPASKFVGATLPSFVSPEACELAMERINARQTVSYDGAAAATLSTGLGTSAWEARYPGIAPNRPDSVESWKAYFDSVDAWDADRVAMFADCFGGDPIDHIVNTLTTALGKPIERAMHPRYGRRMGVGLVRKGAAKAHFDFAKDDIGYNSAGHIGIVLVVDAGPDAVQRAWDYQPEPDEEGNYDSADWMLDPRLTDFIDIPTPVGCLSLLCARYVHEIIDDPDTRCTIAAHLAWLPDGDRWVIYA